MQDIKSDKASGLRYWASREGKRKQGVSSSCHYPHSGNGITQCKAVVGRNDVGTPED